MPGAELTGHNPEWKSIVQTGRSRKKRAHRSAERGILLNSFILCKILLDCFAAVSGTQGSFAMYL